MKKRDLLAEIRRPRTWQRLGKSVRIYQNLLDWNLHAARPNSKWVADIACIQTQQGTLYLSMIRDLCDICYCVQKTMRLPVHSSARSRALIESKPDNLRLSQ